MSSDMQPAVVRLKVNGALDTIAYPDSPVPAGQSGARFTVKYGYSYGAPSLINDVTQSPARNAAWPTAIHSSLRFVAGFAPHLRSSLAKS